MAGFGGLGGLTEASVLSPTSAESTGVGAFRVGTGDGGAGATGWGGATGAASAETGGGASIGTDELTVSELVEAGL